MAVVGEDYYEGSDESSESELLDRSLSVWRGWQIEDEPDFKPVSLDTHTAASIGQYDHVWTIIQRGEEDINKKNIGGWTPLMYACYIGHENIVNLFIDAGVSVNVKNGIGQTPLMLAASCGNESVAYFLLQAGADIEARDKKGWTSLYHATYSGHQNMVKFLLDSRANPEAKEPGREFTPFMEAASAGHEIIVQCFLQHGVNVNAKSCAGDTARALAMTAGHTKIVSLIDNHLLGPTLSPNSKQGVEKDLSSSDESYQHPRRGQRTRKKHAGPSIEDGPAALAQKMFDKQKAHNQPAAQENNMVPSGYIQFAGGGSENMAWLDIIPPILPDEHSAEDSAFLKTGALTMKGRIGSHGRDDSVEDCDTRSVSSDPGQISPDSSHSKKSLQKARPILGRVFQDQPQPLNAKQPAIPQVRSSPDIQGQEKSADNTTVKRPPPGFSVAPVQPVKNIFTNPTTTSTTPFLDPLLGQLPQFGNLPSDTSVPQSTHNQHTTTTASPAQTTETSSSSSLSQQARQEQAEVLKSRPKDLGALLESLGLGKYIPIFEEQDVDLQVFLTLTDSDLKEVGIKLFGPRRKMTNAIARWHLNARPAGSDLEQAYADKLMTEVQELNTQLQQTTDQIDSCKHQILQEQELRSVTETALMETRVAWQQVHNLSIDSRQRLAKIKELLLNISQYQTELTRRFGAESPFSRSGSHGRESLAEALKEKLLIAQKEAGVPAEIPRLPTQQLLRRIQAWYDELTALVAMVTLNTDKLLGRENDPLPWLQSDSVNNRAGAVFDREYGLSE